MDDFPFRERRIAAPDGLMLYARDYGPAGSPRLPLLCLTGITRNSKDFHGLAQRHAGTRRVVVPEYRGRGLSARDPDWHHYTPACHLADTIQVMAALGIDRAVVVGTSLGGLLALALNAVKPGALAALVLNDIGPELGPGTPALMERIGIDLPQPDWPAAVRRMKEASPPLSIRDDQGWLDFARRTYREGDDGLLHVDWDVNLVRAAAEAPLPDLWALYRGLGDTPLMVVRGGVSDLLTEAVLARMTELRPDLVAVTVPGVGHTPFLDEPEVVGPLDAFIERF